VVADVDEVGRGESNSRIMNRRNLCKALIALALGGLFRPVKHAVAEPTAISASGNHPASGIQRNEQKLVVCILRRQAPGTPETFLKNM
jgi:hypothetical protein